jgi:hypothetical protein
MKEHILKENKVLKNMVRRVKDSSKRINNAFNRVLEQQRKRD